MSLHSVIEAILNRVIDAGAEGDLIVDQGQSLSLKARDGELEEHKVTSNRILGLRVIQNAKVGTAYSEAVDPEAIETLVSQALTNASYAGEEPSERILPNANHLTTDDTLLCPDDESSIEDKIDFALWVEAALKAKPMVKNVPYNGVQSGFGHRSISSTAGLKADIRYRSMSAYAYALIEDGETNAMEGAGQAARRFSALDREALVSKVYQAGVDILQGKPISSGRYDVIFDTETQSDLLAVFAMMFSAKSAKDGVNPMRDRLGDAIADPRLSLFDDPGDSQGFGYALFDDEGSLAQQTPLITAGTLQTLIHNSATAAHFGVTTTGHATRGPRSTLGVGLHQLKAQPGPSTEATCTAGRWLEVTDLTGLHSGANPISGEFSFGASGYLREGAQRIQPVRNITVAGNFYSMIKDVRDIGDSLHWNWQRSSCLPMIRFADLSVSG